MQISKEDWIQWQSSEVTKAFFNAIQERINDTKDVLVGSAGLDSSSDNFYRGFIAGQNEITEFKIEFDEEDK